MNSQFKGKCAFVTGGNKGIGLAICQGLVAAGFDVIVAARSLDKAKTAIEKLSSNNSKSLYYELPRPSRTMDEVSDASSRRLCLNPPHSKILKFPMGLGSG